MSSSRPQALLDARKLVRTFAAAPDPRRRAQTVLAGLKRAEGWSATQEAEIAAADLWLKQSPSVVSLEPRLRALLAALS